MAKPNFCQLFLTCTNVAEASEIAEKLLDKRLIACSKQLPAKSDYLWKGKIESDKEILLVMESKLDLFNQIEKEIAKMHSYDTFVLEAISVDKVSSKAKIWLEENLI